MQLETEDHSFQEADLLHLQKIAIQTAWAIENMHPHNQPLLYRQQMISLGHLTQQLSSYMDRKKIVQKSVEAITTLLKCSRASILLLNKKEDALKIVCARGIDSKLLQNTMVPIENSIAGKVLRKKKPPLDP